MGEKEAGQARFPEPTRKGEIILRLSEFEFPPMQDVLLTGRKAPIGPEAVRRMVEALSPEQYEIIRLEHPLFDAVVLKKSLLKLLPREKLLPIILEEGERVATENTIVKVHVSVIIHVSRAVEL
ncbi:MAG: hypothetical protein U1D96_04060 [Eubacteriales bacterium]|nr:hypothetical protein [Bacillota bacterium]MBV1728580.1 hypothetical protein [Desulforudis sp.]MDP3050275.1 hypothetical protein [Eubacteriales bacterium]MBU4533721.1 hypothetical protein [Bacillota bacterium]MBU4554721.1 hypothetical protein [Bacillota bacterium]